mgnify:CR=1 FL=1
MIRLEMTISQGVNGWVIEYPGHNCLKREVITTRWDRVIKEVNDYFGWYNADGKHSKKPFYDEDNE